MAKEKAEEVGVTLVRFVAQHIATTHCTKATIISYVGQENHVVFFFPSAFKSRKYPPAFV